ncbi:hypothetical protein STEG23_002668, partial [Scotinomys teguina]
MKQVRDEQNVRLNQAPENDAIDTHCKHKHRMKESTGVSHSVFTTSHTWFYLRSLGYLDCGSLSLMLCQ